MRHDQPGVLAQRDVAQGRPFRRLHPEPVHPAVELDAESMAGQGLKLAQQLLCRVDHRRQRGTGNRLCIARHMPGKDIDHRAFAQGLAQGHALFGQGHEELPRTGRGQCLGHTGGAQPIAVGFDHGGGLGLCHTVEGAPVVGDGL